MSARVPHLVFAGVLLIIAAVVCVESASLVVWTPIGPGPGFFTVILGGLLGVLAVGLAWENRREAASASSPTGGDDPTDEDAPVVTDTTAPDSTTAAAGALPASGRPGGRLKLLLVAAPLIVLPFVFELLGFRVSVVALLSYLLIYVERRRVIPSLLLAVLASIVAFYVFADLLAVSLPIGVLGV